MAVLKLVGNTHATAGNPALLARVVVGQRASWTRSFFSSAFFDAAMLRPALLR